MFCVLLGLGPVENSTELTARHCSEVHSAWGLSRRLRSCAGTGDGLRWA